MVQDGEKAFVRDNAEAVQTVLNQKFVYLMESTSLEYEIMQNCNLTYVPGMVLGSKGYGIALRKGNFAC